MPFFIISAYTIVLIIVIGMTEENYQMLKRFEECLIRLPLWVGLSDSLINIVIKAVKKFYTNYPHEFQVEK